VTPYLTDSECTLYLGDALEVLSGIPDAYIDAVVTSPPYLDARPEYPSPTLEQFEDIFYELRRVVRGPMLVNVGRIFRGRREVRWWVQLLEAAESGRWKHLDTRIWVKPNGNPIRGEVFADRHEYVFVLGEPGVALNVDAVRVPYAESSLPRFKRGWTNHVGVKGDTVRKPGRHGTEPHPEGARPPSYIMVDVGREKGNPHPAPMPLGLASNLVELASWPGQTVLDPFCGSGTTIVAARRLKRKSVGIDLSDEYCQMAAARYASWWKDVSLTPREWDDDQLSLVEGEA